VIFEFMAVLAHYMVLHSFKGSSSLGLVEMEIVFA